MTDDRDAAVRLIGPPGIFKPAILPELPLTITTAPPVEHRDRPYDDGFIDGGFLRYRYRGTDPNHRDNVGLRTAMQRQTPLIYLHGIVQGPYEPAWPVDRLTSRPCAQELAVETLRRALERQRRTRLGNDRSLGGPNGIRARGSTWNRRLARERSARPRSPDQPRAS